MKGFGILLAGGALCHDHKAGRPFFVKTKRAAERALADELPSWCADGARVVKVERTVDVDGLETYEVRSC